MAAPIPDDADDPTKEDFYSLLNISKEASKDEINQAYKRLSKVYHPDKHQDPVHKKDAEHLFSKLKKAHEILVDEHKRVIYDLYGEKGLESFGMEVISRTKTPAEIIAEYERFQQEQEERRLTQRTNPKGSVTVEINATELFDHDPDYDDEEDSALLRMSGVEISTMSITHSAECPLTNKDTAILAGTVTAKGSYKNSGVFMATWRRLLSGGGWTETELSIGNNTRPALRFKASSLLFKRCVGTVSTRLQVTDGGIGLGGLMGVLTYQFDKHVQGRMVYNPAGVSTAVLYDTEKHQALVSVQVGLKASFLLVSYTKKFPEAEGAISAAVKAGTFGAVIEYGVEKKISMFSNVGATVSVGFPTGVSLRIKVDRGQQTFLFPINLSEEIVPSAVFYGTVAPVVLYLVVKNLIVNPFLAEKKEKELEKTKQEQMEKMSQRKKEAEALIELMKETVERSIEIEEKKNGLVIIKALYGKLVAENQEDLVERECIDVSIPLQALVKESKLISPEKNSKMTSNFRYLLAGFIFIQFLAMPLGPVVQSIVSLTSSLVVKMFTVLSSLPGFYDPCIGEDKRLYIRYKFRNKLHHVTLEDLDLIRLPQQKHLVRDGEPLHSSASYSTIS